MRSGFFVSIVKQNCSDVLCFVPFDCFTTLVPI